MIEIRMTPSGHGVVYGPASGGGLRVLGGIKLDDPEDPHTYATLTRRSRQYVLNHAVGYSSPVATETMTIPIFAWDSIPVAIDFYTRPR